MTLIDNTLNERGTKYGKYPDQAALAQAIKMVFRSSPNWSRIPPYMRESLDMMANKMARCLNGDWTYSDNWHDIIGYARLTEVELLTLESNSDEEDCGPGAGYVNQD